MEANKTDNFYKEVFSGFEYKLSGSVIWRKLKWRLFWIDFKYYIAGAGVLAIIGAGLFFGLSDTDLRNNVNNPESYQTFSINYQSEVLQTVMTENPQSESNLLLLNEAEPPIEFSETSENERPVIIQDLISNSNAAYGYGNPEIRHETPLAIESPFVRENEILSTISAVSTSGLSHLQPELIYDSISQLFIPKQHVFVSLSLYASPVYNVPEIIAKDGDSDYINYRNNNETPSLSFSVGMDVQLNIKNWYIQTGLAYSRFSNYRNYNHTFLAYDSLSSYYSNDTTWGWLYDPPEIGKPVVIGIDTVWVPVYNDLNEGKNEWNYLEIPLLVGYKFNKSRFSFDVATGFSYGLLLNASGNVPSLSHENMFTELSEMNNLMNRNQFNYILQLGLSYHLTPEWSIMAKPFYKQNLRSIFNDTYPIDQRFSSFGIKFGLIVDL